MLDTRNLNGLKGEKRSRAPLQEAKAG